MTTPNPTPHTPSENNAAPQPTPTNTPKKQRKGRLKTILLSLLTLGIAIIAFCAWLITTESGLRFALFRLPIPFGVHITAESLQGTLLKGFQGEQWQIETDSANLTVSQVAFGWQPNALPKHLHITHIDLGDIHYTAKNVLPPEDDTPIKMPESIDLPLTVAIDRISIGRISTDKDHTPITNSIQAQYRYDTHQHQLTLHSLNMPWSESHGSINLHTAQPFALNGLIESEGVLEEHPMTASTTLAGSLADIQTALHLESGETFLKAESVIHPFAGTLNRIIDSVQVKGRRLNPQAFLPSLPKANLEFDALIAPVANGTHLLEGSIDLANHAATAADAGGLPITTLLADFSIDNNGIIHIADSTEARLLQQGRLTLSGDIDSSESNLKLTALINNVSASDLLQQKLQGRLNGRIDLNGHFNNPAAKLALNTGFADITAQAAILTNNAEGQRTLTLSDGLIKPEKGGEMKFGGTLELFNDQALDLTLTSKAFNPARFYPDFPTGSMNGNLTVNGKLAKQLFNGKMQFGNSTLSGVPLSGSANIAYETDHLSRALTDIRLGRNTLKTNGSFGRKTDRLNLDINAPELDKFGFGIRGLLIAKGSLTGDPKNLEADLSGRAENLYIQQSLQINRLNFTLQGSPNYNSRLKADIQGNRIIIPGEQQPTVIDNIALNINGTGRKHTIRGNGAMQLDGKPYRLNLEADGGMADNHVWKGSVGVLDIAGAFNLKLQNRLNLEAGAERVVMSAARWSTMNGTLNLQSFSWQKNQGLTTKGSANNLHIAQLHNFYTPPVEHNLVLAGEWDLSYSQNMRGFLTIKRQSGDIILPQRNQQLGLGNLVLDTRFQNGRINSTLNGTTAYGNVDGNVVISQQFGNDITQAPISGNIRITAAELEKFRNFLPVDQILKGRLNAEAVISGKVGQPQLNGTLNGENLHYRNRDLGLILDNGSLRSRLQGQKWLIDSLKFQRGGTVELKGEAGLVGSAPNVNVDVIFNQYNTLDKYNRRLTLSGNTRLIYTEANGVTLTGALKADSGYFGFQNGSMPTLSDDVVVLGEPVKEKTTTTAISLNLDLDLNNAIRFGGEGLDVLLGGKLKLTAKPGQDIQAIGTVNVVKGQYKAYGQNLQVKRGSISFVGPLDNPNLNIRAERYLSPVEAGVEVLGNLNNPRVTLVANTPMSEKDKLSWLILNRASSGSDGDEAALAAAAGAMLAGGINDRLGLVDDFGLTSRQNRNAQTGELNPAEQVITVGKQLTNQLYLGYEYGINSAAQSVKLIYQITQSLQAIARVGSVSSGGEIKYTVRFD